MTTFFIGGAMRSGTTLLQSVLCSGPQTNPVIHEAHFLAQYFELYRFGMVKFDSLMEHYFDDVADYGTFMADFLYRFFDKVRARYHPADHLVLKSPELSLYFPFLGQMVRDSKYILIVRDPRDTIASALKAGERQAERGITSNLTMMGRDMKAYCEMYRGYYGPTFNSQDEQYLKRVMLVRYESLLEDPQAMVDDLRRFTGLPLDGFDPTKPWARNEVDFSSQEDRQEPFAGRLRGQPFSTDSIGKFQEVLTPEEIAVIQEELGMLMEAFDYEPVT